MRVIHQEPGPLVGTALAGADVTDCCDSGIHMLAPELLTASIERMGIRMCCFATDIVSPSTVTSASSPLTCCL